MRHGFSPLDVKVKRSNLVVANAVDLGEERLRALVDRLGNHTGSPELHERLFKTIWDNIRNVGELGSLVQVREGVTRALENWVDAEARSKGITKVIEQTTEKQLELAIKADADHARAKQLALEREVLEQEAAMLRRDLLAAVEAAAASVADDPSGRLFAEDTERGLKLVQLLSRRYDIAVMNPPYGSFVPKVKDFIRAAYPLTSNDIYAAFIERGCQLTGREGYVAALVPSSFKANSTFQRFRQEILLKRNPLIVMLELGQAILDDATNETSGIVLHGGVL